MAHAARRAVDRHGVARHRPLCGTAARRARAKIPGGRRVVPAGEPGGDRSRFLRGGMVGDQPQDPRPDAKLLVWAPGLRVCGSRAVLADLLVPRIAALGRTRAARPVAGLEGAAEPLVVVSGRDRNGVDRSLVRRWIALW